MQEPQSHPVGSASNIIPHDQALPSMEQIYEIEERHMNGLLNFSLRDLYNDCTRVVRNFLREVFF